MKETEGSHDVLEETLWFELRDLDHRETSSESFCRIKLKSLILAQIERWRHALHMQVERIQGACPLSEWRTGE